MKKQKEAEKGGSSGRGVRRKEKEGDGQSVRLVANAAKSVEDGRVGEVSILGAGELVDAEGGVEKERARTAER